MLCPQLKTIIERQNHQAFVDALQEVSRQDLETPQTIYLVSCTLCGGRHSQEVCLDDAIAGSTRTDQMAMCEELWQAFQRRSEETLPNAA